MTVHTCTFLWILVLLIGAFIVACYYLQPMYPRLCTGGSGSSPAIEWEQRFADVDVKSLVKLLKKRGGKPIGGQELFSVQFFELPRSSTFKDGSVSQVMEDRHVGGFGRVRQEGPRVSLTIKKFIMVNGKKMAEEFESKVDSFVDACNLLLAAGFKQQQFQEKLRQTWKVPAMGIKEVVIDVYPGLNAYVEIECESEEAMEEATKALGFDPSRALTGTTDDVYAAEYGIDAGIFHQDGAVFGFHNTVSALRPHIKTNLDKFERIAAEQRSAGLKGVYGS
jgi:adenylate cyclase class 2